MQKIDDEFDHAMHEIMQEAEKSRVQHMRNHIEMVKCRNPHKQKKYENCLRGLEGKPNLLRLLVASYVINGGVPLTCSAVNDSVVTKEEDDKEWDSLVKDMEKCVTKDIK